EEGLGFMMPKNIEPRPECQRRPKARAMAGCGGGRATGKSPETADKNVCSTLRGRRPGWGNRVVVRHSGQFPPAEPEVSQVNDFRARRCELAIGVSRLHHDSVLGEGIVKGLAETARNFIGSYVEEDRLTTVQYPEE